ncbi:hypothetical protein PR048_010981 [Dryococelus australis]|uniref:Ribosomal protein S7 n=1 Tax=Dryococelus australis TaxID=614101 RepID=A0ABQ9HKT2_9NEOP|nr:hypothetical protein PR048_010981 [Dryococelus australis]
MPKTKTYFKVKHNYMITWKNWKKCAIKFNPTKSVFIVLHRGRDNDTKLHLNNEKMPVKRTINYLGQHFTNAADTAMGKFLQAFPLFKSSKLATETKGMLYRAAIRSAMIYGSEVWGTGAKTHLRKLRATQNKILRNILHETRYTSTEAVQQRIATTSIREEMKTANKSSMNQSRITKPTSLGAAEL